MPGKLPTRQEVIDSWKQHPLWSDTMRIMGRDESATARALASYEDAQGKPPGAKVREYTGDVPMYVVHPIQDEGLETGLSPLDDWNRD